MVLLNLLRGAMSLFDGSPPSRGTLLSSMQKYTQYVIDNNLSRTVITDLNVKIPGVRYKIWSADLVQLITAVVDNFYNSNDRLSRISEMIADRIEIEMDDWIYLNDHIKTLVID